MASVYQFFIQKYSHRYYDDKKATFVVEPKSSRLDVESEFNCKYVSFKGVSETGKVKNIYTENYAETEELRTFIPKDIVYENTELTLTLLFAPEGTTETDIQANERRFFEFVSGRKVEWYDTFRKRYVTLLLLNKPEVVNEVLYGGSRYRQVKYTFKNVFGRSFDKSQIK